MTRFKLVGRIPVEPLDDERMTNIERRIVTGAADAAARRAPVLRAPGWRVAAGVAVAAALVAGAGVVGWSLRDSSTTVTASSEPLQIRTDRERSTIDIGDATITSDPDTAFTVTRPDGGALVTMTRGKVELDVDKRGGRAPLVVAAGDTRVVVVGTRFSVDYGDGTNGVDVRVTEGVVEVEREQQASRVAAGQAWSTERGVVALAELPSRGRGTGVRTSDSSTISDGDTSDGATIADADTTGDDAIEIDTGDAPNVLRDRVASVPDTRTPETRPRDASTTPSTGATTTPRTRPTLDAPDDRYRNIKAAIRSQPLAPVLDVGDSNPASAVAEYRGRLMKPDASHALYSMAVTQHLKLGRNGDALNTIDMYLRRFTKGEHRTAVLWLRVRILCLKTIDAQCRHAAEAFEQHAPDTPAARVAEAIRLSR